MPGVPTYRCDLCGHAMTARQCKILCPNCGYRWDCSDLTLDLRDARATESRRDASFKATRSAPIEIEK